jgi:hypothetical protein
VSKDARDGEIEEAVRLARYVEPSNSRVTDNYVELKRTDESTTVLRIVRRMLPRNGGRALFLLGDAAHAPGCATLPKGATGSVCWKSSSCRSAIQPYEEG